MNKFNFIILLLSTLNTYSQRLPEMEALNRIVINRSDTIFRFYTLKPDQSFRPMDGKLYFWYTKDTILETSQGYSGKLLHGIFQIFYPNKNLLAEGKFDRGLKSGLWKGWFSDGSIKEKVYWKKGEREGKFVFYDEKGALIRKGSYHNNLLNGYVEDKKNDSVVLRTMYRNGKLVEVKTPASTN